MSVLPDLVRSDALLPGDRLIETAGPLVIAGPVAAGAVEEDVLIPIEGSDEPLRFLKDAEWRVDRPDA